MSRRSRFLALTLGALLVLAAPRRSAAQAWLPPKGEGVVSLTFGHYAFDGHFDSDGTRDPFGGTRARSVNVEASYALTDRLTVSAGLPFVSSRLSGAFPRGVPLGPLDDGHYHGDLQDFRAEARFLALDGPLVAAPFVAVGIPTGYEVVGEAVPGKGIKEALLGVNVGRTLAPLLPRAYAHVRYSYAILEKVLPDVTSLNRSNADFELGYGITRSSSVRGTAGWQMTHGGLDLEDMRTNPQFFRSHDRAARTNYFSLGAGAAWDATRSIGVFGAFVKTLSGENAHQARSFYLGVSCRFGGSFGG
ncbi:MAG: hypothetical protein ABIS21_05510 [Acidimicrobiales bacterium]